MRLARIALIIMLALGLTILSGGTISVKAAGLQPHSPILINGNGGFTAVNGVVSGRGTGSDPYIIQGWQIQTNQQYGIMIENTSAYFVIQNGFVNTDCATCSVSPASGLVLENVRNGLVQNMNTQATMAGLNACVPPCSVVVAPMFIDNSANIVVRKSIMIGYDDFGNFVASVCIANSTKVVIKEDYLDGSESENAVGLDIENSTDITVSNSSVYGGPDRSALFIVSSANVTVSSNLLYDQCAIDVEISRGIVMTDNSVDGNIAIDGSREVSFESNNVMGGMRTAEAIDLEIISLDGATGASSGVKIFHNNFMNHLNFAVDYNPAANSWDNGYPSGRNFWLDYTGVDNCTGQSQNVCPSPDGLGDTPFVLPFYVLPNCTVVDRYPLIKPFAFPVAGSVRYSPSVVQSKSDGRYLTAAIKLPTSVSASSIVVSSIRLHHLQLDLAPQSLSISTQDGRVTLIARFNMTAVRDSLQPGEQTIMVNGNILTKNNFRQFTASATIRFVPTALGLASK